MKNKIKLNSTLLTAEFVCSWKPSVWKCIKRAFVSIPLTFYGNLIKNHGSEDFKGHGNEHKKELFELTEKSHFMERFDNEKL